MSSVKWADEICLLSQVGVQSNCFTSWTMWEKQSGATHISFCKHYKWLCWGKAWELFLLPKTMPCWNWEIWEITNGIFLLNIFIQAMPFGSSLNSIDLKCLFCAPYKLDTSKNKICYLLLGVPRDRRSELVNTQESQRRSERWRRLDSGMALMEGLTEARIEVCKLGDYVFQLENGLKSLGLYN